jgi:hypothetical protein
MHEHGAPMHLLFGPQQVFITNTMITDWILWIRVLIGDVVSIGLTTSMRGSDICLPQLIAFIDVKSKWWASVWMNSSKNLQNWVSNIQRTQNPHR